MSNPFQTRADAAQAPKSGETEESIKSMLSEDERRANIRLTNSQAHDNEKLTEIKETLAHKTFKFMEIFAFFAAVVFWIYISLYLSKGEPIPEKVMIAFITTTLATVIGLVGFILKGLFGTSK
ncbi:hypothetical protein [Vibrio cholerae]|uniref:hypothetical protein n=1 Tax=Vibrio cholerae TaxID=666 RepID=UPI000B4932F4|nr:hypothetical protein [Vibrio cholerae]EGS7961479.1 hypothetical protein [Vibrio cholerae]ELJ8586999.1 hypothetical protein [Vibrio cholerae]TXX83712.1 hypothetical protein FXE94_09400 [Vibrio cholerae]GHY56299.1 hypothetical protein VCSRO119_3688 [Vibrio cholerae]GIA64618.1 hypothetical protein VCSRO87_3730 [Vibrio cholerae]